MLVLPCGGVSAESASAGRSTVFYLLVAAGGVAGTFFVGIASPMIFRANYDLAIAFAVTLCWRRW